MDIFKYETHCHTSQGSACGKNTGAEIADYYKSLGYTGIVITDHFFGGNTAVSPDLPWEERIEVFCSGCEDAKRRGDEIGLDVFFGLEYAYHGTEFLIYGLGKAWLLKNPEIDETCLKSALALFREAGALIIHAHPFREAPYIDMFRLLPELSDAVEIYNALNVNICNSRAETYAQMYGLPGTAGGDNHGVNGPAAGISVRKRVKDVFGLMKIVRSGSFALLKP